MSNSTLEPPVTITPDVPTLFVANTGSATPAANTLNVLGADGITTTGIGNTLTISLTGGGAAIDSLTPNSGITPVVPNVAGNVTMVGSGSITTVGSLNTLTTQLIGLTQYNVLVGAGTDTITKVAPTASLGIPLISQGNAANPIFGTALVAGGGTGATSFNTNGVLISNTTSTGALAALSLTSGQVVIGGSGAPAAATLTAGTGITITNGNNSITIAANDGGMTWTEVTGTSQSAAVDNGYVANNAGLVTVTLPATCAIGDVIQVVGKGAGLFRVTHPSGANIFFSDTGYTNITALERYDAITVRCITANTAWVVETSVGNFTVA